MNGKPPLSFLQVEEVDALSLSLARTDYIRNGKSNGKGFVDLPCKDCKKKKKKRKTKKNKITKLSVHDIFNIDFSIV